MFLKSYDSFLKIVKDDPFYIFGNTGYACYFYLFCKENHIEKNIKSIILSDLSRDKRKIHLFFDIPIIDIKQLNIYKDNNTKIIFAAVSEKTLKSGVFDNLNSFDIYFTTDFIHKKYYYYLLDKYTDVITDKYLLQINTMEPCYSIRSGEDKPYFKYVNKISNGVLTDMNIFGDGKDIYELYKNQLGDYIVFHEAKVCRSKHSFKIYIVRSHFDRKLKEKYFTSNTEFIQVGAALTDISIAELKDNTGDNISIRNRDYCEITALYWAWKNDNTSDYIGIEHYRRRFVIDDNIMNNIANENYDAVYTIPRLTEGGMRAEFVERNYYLTPEMWNLTTEAIKKLYPDYLESWNAFADSFFLVSCNMLIMRKDVLNNYCSWLFPILKEIDSYYLSKGIQRNDRYLGYIAECLNTVFIMKNKNNLKKAFVEMKLLETE